MRVSALLPSPGTPHFIWWLREAYSISDECARSQAPTLLLSGQSKQHGLELVISVFLRWPLHVVASRKVATSFKMQGGPLTTPLMRGRNRRLWMIVTHHTSSVMVSLHCSRCRQPCERAL